MYNDEVHRCTFYKYIDLYAYYKKRSPNVPTLDDALREDCSVLDDDLCVAYLCSSKKDRDTSLTNAKHFATEPTISLALWTSSYHWAKSDKNVICLNNESSKVYYIPTRDLDSIPQKDLNRYKTQKFTTFNQLKKSFDIWCLEVENDSNWRKSKCNCPAFLKNFICKHVVGMGIRLKHCKPPAAAKTVPIGEKRKRGRPSRAKTALLVQ
ncbi:unnamed protein product [Adineta steineri]|uniref:SWIM-type domain-containing protein n=1 Tax=Adineta steineri TaxID=433720 RepID=A0A814R249_9BILA|nr:unnamed protein product [Adineta steineri]